MAFVMPSKVDDLMCVQMCYMFKTRLLLKQPLSTHKQDVCLYPVLCSHAALATTAQLFSCLYPQLVARVTAEKLKMRRHWFPEKL